jgi:outer membrane protein OmpA-like peptidoglycan-associated protein
VVVPLTAEYEYRGVELYRDIPVHRITAKYASRYQGGRSAAADEAASDPRPAITGSTPAQAAGTFTGLQGTHTVDILLRVSDGLPLMTRDTLDDTYTWPNGATVRFRGFTLTFGEGAIPLNRDTVIASLGSTLEGGAGNVVARGTANDGTSPIPGVSGGTIARTTPPVPLPQTLGGGIDLAPVPDGVKLTIRDLRFAPDSDEFLPAERSRLDLIAQALQEVPDRTFLVEGHTAAVGRLQGEQELSLDRAKRMVGELVRRGISADRFIYKGWGGTKPLGDNSTGAGRARNRRVEITILE